MVKNFFKWVEISRSALIHNIHQFRIIIGDNIKLLAVVKANAYGHGILEVSRIALEAGVDWLGVNSLEEALLLRREGIDCPLLVLGYLSPGEVKDAVANDLRLTVYNSDTVELLGKAGFQLKKNVNLHLKLETGTYRQGIHTQDLLTFMRKIQEFPFLAVEGLSSHFANIEDTTDHSYPKYQMDNFKKAIQRLKRNGIDILVKHISCTASTILFPETYFDMVRVGIGMYGMWPSKQTYLSCLLQKRQPLSLRPVLSWKTRIAQIKSVPKGSFIGYGCSYRTTRKTLLAVLPVGYFDGYSRSLSNSSHVLIRGHRAPLRGRVCMNFIMVDVTDIPGVNLEDEVVLIGREREDEISADDLAVLAGTINYEVVTRINPQIPRVVV